MKSLYICFSEANRVELREEEVPAPEPGQILCQADKSLISSGTETHCLRGIFDPGTNWAAWVRYPFRTGYSMSSHVVGVGRDVKGIKEGDRVSSWAAHQQFFRTTPDQVYPIPDALSAEEATWGTIAVTTQLAVRRAELQLGETVGVAGLGVLGQLVTQYVQVNGVRRVIAMDPAPVRAEMAGAHGAAPALAVEAQAAREQVAEITGGRMLDAIWDVTGYPNALNQCIGLLRRLGRVILVGDTPVPTQQAIGPGMLSNSIAILGVHGSVSAPDYSEWTPWTRREMTMLFFDYVVQGRMRVKDMVTHRFSPAEAPQVYETLLRDRSHMVGVILDWSKL